MVAGLIRRHINSPGVRADILLDATTEETFALGETLASLARTQAGETVEACNNPLDLVGRIDLAPGEIRISISAESIAKLFSLHDQAILTS
jgi:hypothetical protein